MKAIILAAGRGTRISQFIEERPKCTVDIGGTTLIEYTVELLQSRGIEDIVIVVGYQQARVREALASRRVTFEYNPFFDVTNGIASVWFAREHLVPGEDTILMSGDVFLAPEIVDELLTLRQTPVLLADPTRIEEADYRYYYQNGLLLKFGKDLSIEETTGECLGVAKLSGDAVALYKNHMEEMIHRQCHSVWWENVLYDLVGKENIYVHEVRDHFWAEVDFVEDYRRIVKYRKEKGCIQ